MHCDNARHFTEIRRVFKQHHRLAWRILY